MRFEASTKLEIPGGRLGSNRINAPSLDAFESVLDAIDSATESIRKEIQEIRK